MLHSSDRLYMIKILLNGTIYIYAIGTYIMFYGDILIVAPELPSLICSPGVF